MGLFSNHNDSQIKSQLAGEFDYIIVGLGSAGCILAGELSKNPNLRILALEAGGPDNHPLVHFPIGYGALYFHPKLNWKYQTAPDKGLGGRSAYWPRGKLLGGSGSINAMVWCRGLPQDHDDWQKAGNPSWGWAATKAAYEAIECQIDEKGTPSCDPKMGERIIVTAPFKDYHPMKDQFFAAGLEIGLGKSGNINGDQPEGVAAYPINAYRGRRVSSARAWLNKAKSRKNLTLITHAYAEKILCDNHRASGLKFTHKGQSFTAKARGEIILCAGAIGTPCLLQASGFGNGRHISAHGTPVIYDNPAIGANLQDHLGINYYYRTNQPTLNQALGSLAGRVRAGLSYLYNRRGPLALSVNQLGGLVRSHSGLEAPDIQLYCNPLSYSYEVKGKREMFRPDPFPGFILSFNPTRPQSRGHVRWSGGPPWHAPEISPNSLSHKDDETSVIAGARLIEKLEASTAFIPLITQKRGFIIAGASDEQILDDFRARAGSVYHPCGTCRMAPLDQGGVVDDKLRLYGVTGLRVADASIFPNITSGNTNAPTMMVAKMATSFISQTQPIS